MPTVGPVVAAAAGIVGTGPGVTNIVRFRSSPAARKRALPSASSWAIRPSSARSMPGSTPISSSERPARVRCGSN